MVLEELNPVTREKSDLVARAEDTLRLMHDWGYAPTLPMLATDLLGGSVNLPTLDQSLRFAAGIRLKDGFVCLSGHEHLLDKSMGRVRSHHVLNGHARILADEFARDVTTLCPYVECIALSGSVASGGYDSRDDIDFDLFVRPGTKYLCYLLTVLVSLKYSWRYRKVKGASLQKIAGLPKVTCVNVVWTQDQTKPFVRQDAAMAFELLHCQPLVGGDVFLQVLEDNRWLEGYFPQLFGRTLTGVTEPRNNRLSLLFAGVERRPRMLRLLERISRAAAWLLYAFAQATWGRQPATRARIAFLKRVKYPYEVFQD